MKRKFWSLLIVSLIGFVFSNILFAQNTKNDRAATAASSLYVISAKAGAVNYVSGKVSVAKKDSKSGYLLKSDNLEVGDKVSTGVDGKVEILLNPGSYARLSENSQFEFTTTSLDDLQVKLNSGSSIFEVIADNHFKVTVDTGKSTFYLIKSGIYRVDVLSDGVGKISVWKGKAQIGDTNATIIKGGKSATITSGQATVAKFDRDNRDDLENWSRSRAKEIAKINEKLIQREMNRSLLNSFGRNGGSSFNGYGLWVFDASNSSSCFLPFGYRSSSPYGFTYNQSIWNYSAPATIYYNNNPSISNPNYGNNLTNGSQPGYNPPIQTPPMGGGNNGGNNGGNSGNPFPQSPISSPPMDVAPSRPTITERKQDMSTPADTKRID